MAKGKTLKIFDITKFISNQLLSVTRRERSLNTMFTGQKQKPKALDFTPGTKFALTSIESKSIRKPHILKSSLGDKKKNLVFENANQVQPKITKTSITQSTESDISSIPSSPRSEDLSEMNSPVNSKTKQDLKEKTPLPIKARSPSIFKNTEAQQTPRGEGGSLLRQSHSTKNLRLSSRGSGLKRGDEEETNDSSMFEQTQITSENKRTGTIFPHTQLFSAPNTCKNEPRKSSLLKIEPKNSNLRAKMPTTKSEIQPNTEGVSKDLRSKLKANRIMRIIADTSSYSHEKKPLVNQSYKQLELRPSSQTPGCPSESELKILNNSKVSQKSHTEDSLNTNDETILSESELDSPVSPKQKETIIIRPMKAKPRFNMPNHTPARCSVKGHGIVEAYAIATNQGVVRDYNEDRVSVLLNIARPSSYTGETWPNCSFFGVFDGHAGSRCADYLRDYLHTFVIK